MINRTNYLMFILTLSLLTVGTAVFPNDPSGPLSVTAAGGGCSNCICLTGLPYGFPGCDATCQMPLSAIVKNKSQVPMLVRVTLEVTLPADQECANPSAYQVEQYLLPGKGTVTVSFNQAFSGVISGALFSAYVVVMDADSQGLEGKDVRDQITVSTAWKICNNGKTCGKL